MGVFRKTIVILYAITIFASAFLLFLLQLVTAKQILPWFGGSAVVWTTCLVFFQSVLLLGYLYSDWSVRRLAPKGQALVHVVLLASSLLLLPVMPDTSWKPVGTENPAWHILGLLSTTIGLPYFLLSTTSPLIQAWFARRFPGRSPYRLFALSNLASMIALLGYPLAIEPWTTTTLQAQAWSTGYAVFIALCGITAWFGLRMAPADHNNKNATDSPPAGPPPSISMHLLWIALAAMGSILLLAVTNHLVQDIASIPLLWVLPLSIYLLTFIMCFDGHGWYRRNLFLGLLAICVCVMAWWLSDRTLILQIGLYSAGLFVCCMFCHGELNRLRPEPAYLTRFYLMVSLGGALGALLVGIAAPLLLPEFYELGIGLAALAALGVYQVRNNKIYAGIGAAILLFVSGAVIYKSTPEMFAKHTVLTKRNFYGVLRVLEFHSDDPDLDRQRALIHGHTMHGEQYPSERWRRIPTTYYQTNSGIGRALMTPRLPGARIGIIGLGAGTIAAYGRRGDTYRFYELNPSVVEVARNEFTFLKYSEAKIEIILGDARLNLEREPSQQFDVLVVDAFSGDSIPMHLITSEALTLYLNHLKPGGIIAFHVSNLYLNLPPVVKRLADEHGLKTSYMVDEMADNPTTSHWVLLTANQNFLDSPPIKSATLNIEARPNWRLWTDDFNNLVQVIKFGEE